MKSIEAIAGEVAGTTVHRFEVAGLGLAPYRYLGCTESVFRTPDGTERAGASCDYCATSIRWVYRFLSADRREFKLGSDCIAKADDAGLLRIVDREEMKRRREKSAAKAARATDDLAATIEAKREALQSAPHSKAWMAAKGATMLDEATWWLENAGTAGRTKMARRLRAEF